MLLYSGIRGGITMENNNEIKDNSIQESTRTQLSKLDEHRTKLIDTKIKRNKEFSIVSGAVAAMSATTVIGNLFMQNYQVSAQNTGTLIAMIAYSIGNYLMYKKATEEKFPVGKYEIDGNKIYGLVQE